MRVLLDHGTPCPIARWLPEHVVVEAKAQGWDRFSNGALLDAAEASNFDVLLTTDKNMQYQQNLQRRKIAIVVLGLGQWPYIKRVLSRVVEVVNVAKPGSVITVDIPLPPPKSIRTLRP